MAKHKEPQIKVRANALIELHDLQGRLLKSQRRRNLVVNGGLQLIRDLIGGLRKWPTDMAVGTGTLAVAATQTALDEQVYQDLITRRVQQTYGIKYQLFIPAVAPGANDEALTEAALLTVLGATTTMFARVTFDPFAKNSGNTLTVTWTVTVAAN